MSGAVNVKPPSSSTESSEPLKTALYTSPSTALSLEITMLWTELPPIYSGTTALIATSSVSISVEPPPIKSQSSARP